MGGSDRESDRVSDGESDRVSDGERHGRGKETEASHRGRRPSSTPLATAVSALSLSLAEK